MNRLCAKKQKMLEILYFFPEDTNKMWQTKVLA